MVDHMLVKVGKYLRILGYDAGWDTGLRTHELITKANRDDRLFVSRNRRLAEQYPLPRRLVLVRSAEPVRQLDEVVEASGISRTERLFSRCIRCNVELLEVVDKEKVRGRVHPNVFLRYDRFFRCPMCGTVFWKGSHVKNTCRKLRIAAALALALWLCVGDLPSRADDALLQRLSEVKPSQRVNDYAGVMKGAERRELEVYLSRLDRATGVTIVVVTLESLEGGQIDDFANRLYEAWGIGREGEDRGALLLAAVKDRKVRIEVGYGLEGELPDAKAGRLLDRYVLPSFRAGSYGEGIRSGAMALARAVSDRSGVAAQGRPPVRAPPRREEGGIPWLSLLLLIVLIPVVIRHPWLLLFLMSSGRGGGGFSGGGFGGGFGGFGGGLSGGGGASRGW